MIRNSDLKGYEIPGKMDRLKATLFADDTTVYLSEEDDFGVLQGILDKWCTAAKAKFNLKKTEIIPIGDRQYRIFMADTYRDTGNWRNYPRGVHMANEGDAIRILGAFFGNNFEECAPWTPRMEKIAQVMARWARGHSTIEGRRHAVSFTIGAMTQYLTEVQRMPEEVKKRLIALERSFYWDGKSTSPVALEYLYAPFENGGRKLLDIQSRNDAIDLVWLKDYLNMGPNRPTWAYIADALLA
ncbi:hypothetical protein K525DRAFT_180766, partial [Schizophyllum commune Loenen D]